MEKVVRWFCRRWWQFPLLLLHGTRVQGRRRTRTLMEEDGGGTRFAQMQVRGGGGARSCDRGENDAEVVGEGGVRDGAVGREKEMVAPPLLQIGGGRRGDGGGGCHGDGRRGEN
ncbi:hypothetical protein DEO72_LG4g796 [Vigna unguiculata]|uniref:Uncharacterized protein n=1 Tax=Vigna unguiculata TaxID=3917 RepID=A0A4D6LNR9_VIGUN|nr:hypothetical protein DEO72_LG4g796 [Vigna unguiculata]